MTLLWHEPVYHAAHDCQAASLSLTVPRVRGLFWACQIESQKNAGFLALVEPHQHELGPLGCSPCMMLLCLLKGGGLIAVAMQPHGKDDPGPHIGQRSYSHRMAFAFYSFAMILVPGPRFTLRGLPGELMQGIAQGFDTPQTSMGFGVHSALIQHRRGSSQRLQTAGILVALAIIPDFCQQSWSQALACRCGCCKRSAILGATPAGWG